MNRHISILSVLLILGGCVTAPISPEFTERLDYVESEEKDAVRDNRKQPDEQLKRQIGRCRGWLMI